MLAIKLTKHAEDVLMERKIVEKWVWRTINTPSKKRRGDDGNRHYTKPIKEKGGRVLHVVVNDEVVPNRVVTVFFDRRLLKKTMRKI